MLIPRSVLSKAAVFCDTESTRYALGGVLFTYEDGKPVAVATDGRRLTVFRWEDIESPLADHEHHDFTQVIVIAEDCKRMAKLGGYKPTVMKSPQANYVALMEDPESKNVLFKATDLQDVSEASCVPYDGRFPQWKQVLPSTNEYNTISVDRKYLIEALQAIDEATVNIHVDVRGSEHPMIITTHCGVSTMVHALMMPMSNEGKYRRPTTMWHPVHGWVPVTHERQLSSDEAMEAFMAATAREKAESAALTDSTDSAMNE